MYDIINLMSSFKFQNHRDTFSQNFILLSLHFTYYASRHPTNTVEESNE